MDNQLKLYIVGHLLVGEEDEPNPLGIEIGEFPYSNFYIQSIGREVDIEEEGYDEIEEMLDYLLNYPLSEEQLLSIRHLSLETECSAYETLVCPYWDYEPGVIEVKSLEGIEQLPNLKSLSLAELSPGCSLEPLLRLPELEHIYSLSTQLSDYSALLQIPKLKSLRVFGSMASKPTGQSYKQIIEELREKGVEVEDLVTLYG